MHVAGGGRRHEGARLRREVGQGAQGGPCREEGEPGLGREVAHADGERGAGGACGAPGASGGPHGGKERRERKRVAG